MFGHDFYHETTRRYVALFGTLFNDIYISRTDNANNVVNTMKVPLQYAERDKVIERMKIDPEIDRSAAIITPHISFEMLGINYDKTRKLSTTGRSAYPNANGVSSTYVYNPVPYNFDFEVDIVVKNVEDGNKIIEQILPYFTPDFTVSIKIIDNPVIVTDIPVILNDTVKSDNYAGHQPDIRYIIWTLKFVLKGYLYGPINTSKVIKMATVNMIAGPNNGIYESANGVTTRYIDERVVTTPGLTANGQPTSNSAQSVNYTLINWDQNYGYCTDITVGVYANT